MNELCIALHVDPMVRLVRIAAYNPGDLHAYHFDRFELLVRERMSLLTNARFQVLRKAGLALVIAVGLLSLMDNAHAAFTLLLLFDLFMIL